MKLALARPLRFSTGERLRVAPQVQNASLTVRPLSAAPLNAAGVEDLVARVAEHRAEGRPRAVAVHGGGGGGAVVRGLSGTGRERQPGHDGA